MLSTKLGVKDISDKFCNKRVLLRVDFNVPIKEDKVVDTTRIDATLPTINYLFEQGANNIVLISHAGRPDGQKNMKYSLKPVLDILTQKLPGRSITFVEDCVGEDAEKQTKSPPKGSIILLENLRFHLEEEGKGVDSNGNAVKASDEEIKMFRASLTKHGDIFVNDAFGTAHRAHSSMVGIQHEIKAAGLLMKKEVDYFAKALENPSHPFLAILGGAKVRDKIQLIDSLMNVVDIIIIGGGMAFTFKKVLENMEIGNSLYDKEGAEIVHKIMAKAKEKNIEIFFPVDFVIADAFSEKANTKIVTDKEGIPEKWEGVDCGPASIKKAKEIIMKSKQIIWNGPQGVFEIKPFSNGSYAYVDMVAEATKNGCISIIGGGDTAALVQLAGKADVMSHVSTGGGAALELLEGKVLPGVQAISSK